MKKIKADLGIIKSVSDKIFKSGYVESDRIESIVGFRSGILSIAVTVGDSNSIHFMQSNITHDVELRNILSFAYYKRGLYIDYSFLGDNDMYAYIYEYEI